MDLITAPSSYARTTTLSVIILWARPMGPGPMGLALRALYIFLLYILSPTAKYCSLNYLKTGSAKRNLKRIISSDVRAQSAISK